MNLQLILWKGDEDTVIHWHASRLISSTEAKTVRIGVRALLHLKLDQMFDELIEGEEKL